MHSTRLVRAAARGSGAWGELAEKAKNRNISVNEGA